MVKVVKLVHIYLTRWITEGRDFKLSGIQFCFDEMHVNIENNMNVY